MVIITASMVENVSRLEPKWKVGLSINIATVPLPRRKTVRLLEGIVNINRAISVTRRWVRMASTFAPITALVELTESEFHVNDSVAVM